jgi:putative transcriptional regulator
MTNAKYESRLMRTLHRAMQDMHAVGVVDDTTMREFDQACLTPVDHVGPGEIRAIRKRERVSQSVFARHLYVSPGLVSKWERGEKTPSGPALKLLSLVKHKGIEAIR